MANSVSWPALNENNDENVKVTLTTNQPTPGIALDLTGQTVEAYLKPSASTADGDASVWLGSSAGGSPAITITDAVQGQVEIAIPAAAVTTTKGWLRVDVISAGGKRKTGPYGAVTVTNL